MHVVVVVDTYSLFVDNNYVYIINNNDNNKEH